MPPRRAADRQATQQHDDDGAGPSTSTATYSEYVAFTLGQAVIAEGCLPENDVKAMLRRLAQRNDDSAYMGVMGKLQKDTQFLGLAIERIKFPLNDEWYVCLVDKEKDEGAKQMGSKYNPDEVQYFRSVVEALCEAQPQDEALLASVNQIVLKNVDVQRQAAAAAGGTQGGSQAAAAKGRKLMSQMDKETALKAFSLDGWLYQPQQGYYTLGPRALGELKDWVMSLLPAEVAQKLQDDYM